MITIFLISANHNQLNLGAVVIVWSVVYSGFLHQ